jgi:CheY-like chemotaxis protein
VSAINQVYLVDDTADYRFLVESIFNRYLQTYSLHLFENGQAFLDALPQLGEKPDLIILDQHMPQMSGYETLVILKLKTDYHSIPVVMMSANASHSEISSFYQAGATSYLAKPMNFDALKETLRGVCQHASKPQ